MAQQERTTEVKPSDLEKSCVQPGIYDWLVMSCDLQERCDLLGKSYDLQEMSYDQQAKYG